MRNLSDLSVELKAFVWATNISRNHKQSSRWEPEQSNLYLPALGYVTLRISIKRENLHFGCNNSLHPWRPAFVSSINQLINN